MRRGGDRQGATKRRRRYRPASTPGAFAAAIAVALVAVTLTWAVSARRPSSTVATGGGPVSSIVGRTQAPSSTATATGLTATARAATASTATASTSTARSVTASTATASTATADTPADAPSATDTPADRPSQPKPLGDRASLSLPPGATKGSGTRAVPGARRDNVSPLLPGSAAELTLVPSGWSTSEHLLSSGGRQRSYLMIRPPLTVPTPPAASSHRLPVVVVLHGRFLNPAAIERISAMIPVVGRAIMVYPAGFGRSWNAGGCCGVAHAAGINDVAFLESVLHQVLATQPDASAGHVYLMGFSNGGRMAYQVACHDPGAFAGVAAVEAVPVFHCARLHPVPLAVVAQRNDPLLSITNRIPRKTMQGYLEPTVQATIDRWRALDGCAATSKRRMVGMVRVTTWGQCPAGVRVEYALYPGGRHSWPEARPGAPSAGQFIWSFLHGGGAMPAVPAAPAA